ncbi:MAG: hypothetical protein Q8M10_00705 [Methylotenera sp.]|uniref:hypothetical protein n=1 Tax=Methylotenera sp. TaxID=2051956 RepID=UPI002730BF74|nr:hypothetical protein [Methylotenera sp.]MDP1521652.1 hypothetical protein [Methylotenera sp.]
MKILHSIILALTICVTSVSSAYARDSFSVGINVGGYGYPAPAIGHSPGYVIGYSQVPTVIYPQTIYYGAPTAYYQPTQVIRYAPVVSYGYQGAGYRDHHRGWGHGGREHHGRDYSGWNRGGHEHHGGRH